MKREAQLVRATLQVLTEAVWAEQISLDELRQQSGVREPLFTLVCEGVERFADAAVLRELAERREPFQWVARQAREEMTALLGALEPVQATAILCGLPSAARLGYATHRLAARLGTSESAVREWERTAYEAAAGQVTERLPLLDAVRQAASDRAELWEQIEEWEPAPVDAVDRPDRATGLEREGLVAIISQFRSENVPESDCLPEAYSALSTAQTPQSGYENVPESDCLLETNQALSTAQTPVIEPADADAEQPEDLLDRAAVDADFDLRRYMAPALELAIRQAFHRHGVHSPERVRPLFSTTEQLAVDLVLRRIELETAGGEEETPDA
ncbi:hypothetical protein OS242_14770 [Tumebacillus sp. DT12]|uniref:RNA polymerase sigma-70 region 4 domain-containing protein n=1 Tax=Tumebacillus lacus TaxID=2995335 RepID=A0ABT3X5H5_9BACL|nr:hypothetical protein [Tumebacillus lacus]MCX7571212.1 hypothetical protein [Tumebacillus lacus]